MSRKLTSLIIIMSLLVVAFAASSYASRSTGAAVERAQVYGLTRTAMQDQSAGLERGNAAVSLGTFTADGGSPGYITGRTFQDQLNFSSPFYTIGWNHSPNLHFAIGAQLLAGEDDASAAKWTEYTVFDATIPPNGAWRTPVMIHTDPLNYNGRMHQVVVDETGHAVVVCHVTRPPDPDFPMNVETYWDVSGPGAYGTFIGDTLPQSISMNPDAAIGYPVVAYQEYNGTYTTHVVAWEPVAPAGWLGYYRRVGANPTVGGWTSTAISGEITWEVIYSLACSRGDGPEGNKVSIMWLTHNGTGPGTDDDANIAYIESTDGGATWPTLGTPTTIINIASEPGVTDWLPWAEVQGLYDSEGYLHISYNAGATVDGASQGIDPARLYHWTNRVAGTNAGGTLSLVHIADFHGLGPMCGRAGLNRTNASNAHLSECNGRLYMIWQQFGDPDAGDSLDCPVDNEWSGGYNADIYMSVSLGLDGSLWDRGRNLTNSKTPDCDSTTANNCDHDNYASATHYGMDVGAMGTTYWGAVPEAYQVRDALNATYPDDGWYVDVHYLNDLYPEIAPEMNTPIWTYSPVKWFRLPCVDPVIEPAIVCDQPDFLAPTDWVKQGTPHVIEDVPVGNIGNDILNVNSITADITDGDPGWIAISGVPSTVAAGGTEYFDVTINPGGIVTTQELLTADIVIDSDDPNNSILTAFTISTIIADTVVQVAWDTIQVATGFGLTVANQGSAGNSGDGLVNLDFLYPDSTGPECDSTQSVYMYDACPIVMYDGSGDPGTYSWNPFWTPDRAASYNFVAVADDVESTKCSGDGFAQYRTSTFVTSDSTLGCVKHWVAPDAVVTWVIEKWEVYSYNGSSVSGARFGEWIDWDIPTGTAGNEGGFVIDAGSVDYVYQQGVVDMAADPAPCVNEDTRFGASGLLGYYTSTEKASDELVNNSGLYGGFIHQDDDLFEAGSDQLIPDSVWAWMNRNTMSANNSADDDQQAFLSYGAFDIVPNDTLVIWVVHATVYNSDTDALQDAIDEAETWYLANRDKVGTCFDGCCGVYADWPVWPLGYTGNCNCSPDGKRTLSDITKLIDNVYISKDPLCCYASGNTNGSWDDGDCKITLSDITKLIDAVYISKNLTEPCISGCER